MILAQHRADERMSLHKLGADGGNTNFFRALPLFVRQRVPEKFLRKWIGMDEGQPDVDFAGSQRRETCGRVIRNTNQTAG